MKNASMISARSNDEAASEMSQEESTGSKKWLLAFLGFLSAFPALSTDLYLPALPGMAKSFSAPISEINLTLTLFFIFFGVGTLFWGPLSDKYGRRPVLLAGLIFYMISSGLCALAANIEWLIAARCVQAFGGSAGPSISMAIVKDVYRQREREKALTWIQTLFVLAPVFAPMLGSSLLLVTSWRGVFWCQVAAGIVGILGCLVLQETASKNEANSIFSTWLRLGHLLKLPGLNRLLLIFTPLMAPMMAYIASSSFIYQKTFDLSEQEFSLYFALNALASMTGPWIYLGLSARIARLRLITFGLFSLIVCGVLLFSFGEWSPWGFLLCLMPGTVAIGFLRPPSVSLMLSQSDSDAGSVSSLIGFSGTIGGSLGMFIISHDWDSFVAVQGVLFLLVGVSSLVLWLRYSKNLSD